MKIDSIDQNVETASDKETVDKDEFAGFAYAETEHYQDIDSEIESKTAQKPELEADSSKPEETEPELEPELEETRVESAQQQPVENKQPAQQQPIEERQYTESDYAAGIEQLDKLLDGIAQQYEDGAIDFKQYRAEERKLMDQRGTFQTVIANMRAERAIKEREWNEAVSEFFSDKSNAIFAAGGVLAPSLREALQASYSDPKMAGKPYKQLLLDAANSVRSQFRSILGLSAEMSTNREQIDELKAKREARKASAVATPSHGTRVSAGTLPQSDPWAGWAAED